MRRMVLIGCAFAIVIAVAGPSFGQEALVRELDQLMSAYMVLDQFSGNVLVAKGGEIIYQRSFGDANKALGVANIPDTRFNIGSMGKLFTKVAILQLAQEGKLGLDDTVGRYVPELREDVGQTVTIRHLLDHTSGLSNYMGHPEYRARMAGLRSIDDVLPFVVEEGLRFEPGTNFAYSNSGYILLGAVIEALSGQSYEQYVAEKIWKPAGMNDTGMFYRGDHVENKATGYAGTSSHGRMSNESFESPAFSDGGAYSTVADMLKFDRALYGSVLLDAEHQELMLAESPRADPRAETQKTPTGRKSRVAFGGAPGISAGYAHFFDGDYVVVVLSNYDMTAADCIPKIEAVLYGEEYTMPSRPVEDILREEIQEKGIDYVVSRLQNILKEHGARLESSLPIDSLGQELLMLGRPADAARMFELNVRLFPKLPIVYESLAQARLALGDNEGAASCYEKVLELWPDAAHAKEMLDLLRSPE